MKKVLIILLCLPMIGFAQTPNWEWATGWGTNTNGLKDIAVSSSGESYVIGGFYGQQIIGNDTINSISTNLSCSPQCPQSYIAKLNVNGNLAWTYPVLSTDFTNPIEIKLAPNGYIYALFEYKDPVFSNGAFNFKIIKLDSTGNLISEYISPLTNGGLSAYSMCVDENNNITIPAHLNGGPLTIGSIDYHGPLIVMNLSESLSVNWVYTASSSTSPGVNGGISSGLQITYSETSSQYIVTGQLTSQLIFGDIIIGSPNTSGTYFIVRVDYNGNLINASTINYYPQEIISHQGLVYTAGRTNLNGSSNIQILDLVLTCIDNSNQQIWEQIVGSSSYFDYATDITIDNNDNLYLTGAIHGNYLTVSSVFFDTIQTTVYGLQFVSSFDLNGNINWLEIQDTLTLGGAEFRGIETDNNGSLYLCGNTTANWYDLNLDGNILTSFSNYPEISVVAKLGNYFSPTPGCTNSLACNYDSEATNEDGSCTYPECYYDCDGGCISDTDSDGVCDELEAPYNPDSDNNQIITITDLLNLFPLFGNSFSATCPEGLQEAAPVFNPDYDDNTIIGLPDFLMVLPLFGQQYIADLCPLCLSGCTDPTAFNYDPLATYEDGSCSYTP